MTKVEHQRAPWRDPSREQPAVRPPPEHAGRHWHWLSLDGTAGVGCWLHDGWYLPGDYPCHKPETLAERGWRYIAPCEPPTEGSFW